MVDTADSKDSANSGQNDDVIRQNISELEQEIRRLEDKSEEAASGKQYSIEYEIREMKREIDRLKAQLH